MTEIKMTMDITTDTTPSIPGARRGSFSPSHVTETREQLDQWLVWTPCSFCGGFVLVAAGGSGREKCACGAKHFIKNSGEGWRQDGQEWWFM